MANLNWYPISPTITEKGNFSAFSFEENSSEIKPVPLELSDDPFSQFRVLQNSFNTQIASKLGVGVGSLAGNYDSFVLAYEAMLFTEKTVESPIGGKIYGTRWGAGLRVNLKISELKSAVNFNMGAIAASSELGLSKVEYEINGIGISKPDILSALPDPGDFDFATYQKILDAAKVVKTYMSDHKDELKPKPFQVFLSDDINEDIFTNSRAVLFSIRNIVNRNSLKTAIQNSQNKFNVSTIKSVYARYQILDENQEPTKEQKRKAEDFLNL